MGFVSTQCTCSRATPEHAVPPFPPTRTSAAAHVSALRAWALAHAGWRYMESGLNCDQATGNSDVPLCVMFTATLNDM